MRKHQVLAIGWIIMALAVVEVPGAAGQPFGGGPSPNPAFIYVIANNGILKWFRHNGSRNGAGLDVPGSWDGPKDVGRGWDVQHVFPGGGDIIYAIANDGILKWFEHKGFNSGDGLDVPGSWDGPKDVGRGWDVQHVFSGCDGIIYAIGTDGILKWFRHNGFKTGAGLDVPGSWDGPKDVGRGWDVKHVFSKCDGIIYAIGTDGILKWFRHNGFKTGAGLDVPGSWDGPKDVGRGWQDFISVFSLIPRTPDIPN